MVKEERSYFAFTIHYSQHDSAMQNLHISIESFFIHFRTVRYEDDDSGSDDDDDDDDDDADDVVVMMLMMIIVDPSAPHPPPAHRPGRPAKQH